LYPTNSKNEKENTMSYHTIIIVGRLGRDPELRYTSTGQAVCTLNVATDNSFTNRDGTRVDRTVWFRVTVWGKQAETVNQYLQKGRQVLVEGRMNGDESGNPRVWTRQDGTPAASFEVTASVVRFLGGRGDTASTPSDDNSAVTTSNTDFDFGDLSDDDFLDF
jgi:single-strand DNA-binding protein